MKLVSNTDTLRIKLNNLFDKEGKPQTAPSCIITKGDIAVDITKKPEHGENVFECLTPLFLGEKIYIKQDTFDIEANISGVGNANLYKTTTNIPENSEEITRELDVLSFINQPDGVYYTDNGDMIFVGVAFNVLKTITKDYVFSFKPVFRSVFSGDDEYKFAINFNTAYEAVMLVLMKYENELGERFKYLDVAPIRNLIVYKIISLYEEEKPGNDKTYTTKYNTEVLNFKPSFKTIYNEQNKQYEVVAAPKARVKW